MSDSCFMTTFYNNSCLGDVRVVIVYKGLPLTISPRHFPRVMPYIDDLTLLNIALTDFRHDISPSLCHTI